MRALVHTRYPFRKGDGLRASVEASVTGVVILYVRVRYQDGTPDAFVFPITHSSGDRSHEHNVPEDHFPRDGEIEQVCALTTVAVNILRGQFFMELCVMDQSEEADYPLCAGYVTPLFHVPLGFFEHPNSGRGLKVDNEAASTLVNNTALTRTITVPTNARWLWFTGEIFQGDDVTRTVTVRADDGTTGQNLHVPLNGEGVGATSRRPYPHGSATAGLIGIVMPIPLSAGDRILITFAAGGASAGGTARSSAVVQEWIEE